MGTCTKYQTEVHYEAKEPWRLSEAPYDNAGWSRQFERHKDVARWIVVILNISDGV